MEKLRKDGLEFLAFESFGGGGGLRHGLSVYVQGDGGRFDFPPGEPEVALGHRRRMCGALGLNFGRLVTLRQVHGNVVHVIADGAGASERLVPPAADAVCTDVAGLPLMLFAADCALVLVYDAEAGVVGLAHAGWRPTVGRVVERLVEAMGRELGARPERMRAGIGACICADCYEVGEEVAAAVREKLGDLGPESLLRGPAMSHSERHMSRGGGAASAEAGGGYHFDIRAANFRQLEASGVPGGQIEVCPYCTFEEAGLFPSYRRSGPKAGRWALVAALGGWKCA